MFYLQEYAVSCSVHVVALSMFAHLQSYQMDLYSYCLQSKEGELHINASIEERPSSFFSYPLVEPTVHSLSHTQPLDDDRHPTAHKRTERQRKFVF